MPAADCRIRLHYDAVWERRSFYRVLWRQTTSCVLFVSAVGLRLLIRISQSRL